MIGIKSWVMPHGPDGAEIIIGRVISISAADATDIHVAWLSNQRGLWVNHEFVGDLFEVPPPAIGVIEALMVSAVPNVPFGYEA